MSSVLDEKDDDRIRCCTHCKDTLLKREQQIDEKERTPDIVRLYEAGLFVMCTPADFEECFGKSFLSVIFSFCQWALARALSESQSHWVCCNKLASLPFPARLRVGGWCFRWPRGKRRKAGCHVVVWTGSVGQSGSSSWW